METGTAEKVEEHNQKASVSPAGGALKATSDASKFQSMAQQQAQQQVMQDAVALELGKMFLASVTMSKTLEHTQIALQHERTENAQLRERLKSKKDKKSA